MADQQTSPLRFVEALQHIHKAVSNIARLITTKDAPVSQSVQQLRVVMDDISQAFQVMTERLCRTCIKLITLLEPPASDPQWIVRTLCRNTNYTGADPAHDIGKNTAFKALLQDPERRWFLGNDLVQMARRKKYRNTTNDWRDRYRATMIWPIRSSRGLPASWDLLAFLCVDSLSVNSFSEQRDFPIGAFVSYAFSPLAVEILGANPEDI